MCRNPMPMDEMPLPRLLRSSLFPQICRNVTQPFTWPRQRSSWRCDGWLPVHLRCSYRRGSVCVSYHPSRNTQRQARFKVSLRDHPVRSGMGAAGGGVSEGAAWCSYQMVKRRERKKRPGHTQLYAPGPCTQDERRQAGTLHPCER